MPFRISLVEDAENLNQLLTSYLQKEGWEVCSFLNGQDAREAIASRPAFYIEMDRIIPL